MKELLERVGRHWDAQGIAHGPPVSQADIAEVEARHGVRFPGELRAWFLALNGTGGGDGYAMDDAAISFYRLGDFLPLAQAQPYLADAPGAGALFVFADHMLWSHFFVVPLSGQAADTAPVLALYAPDCIVPAAPSFSAFLESYLAGDDEALFPDAPRGWVERAGDAAERRAFVEEKKPRLDNHEQVAARLARFVHAHARANPRLASGSMVQVTVRMRVDRTGRPGDISVPEPGPDPALDAEAIGAAAEMRFHPAAVGGIRVAVWIRIPITFRFSRRPRPPWKRLFGR